MTRAPHRKATVAEQAVAPNYGLVDEIASRVLATGGRVIAAILRYPA
jgi:hypothetical protein